MGSSAWTPVDETASAWTPVEETKAAPLPDSKLGGAGRRLWDTAKGIGSALMPEMTSQDTLANHPMQAAVDAVPGLRTLSNFIQGQYQGSKGALHQAVDQLHTAMNSPGVDKTTHALQFARPVVTGLSALNPFATGSVNNVNNLADQGRVNEATGQGLADAATLGITAAAKPILGAIKNALPSTERAGAALGQVKAAAGDIPIDMTKPGNTALDLYTQSQRGASLPMAVRKFLTRTTTPDSPPLTYAEAKDFQSNISRLSADEYGKMNPNTKRLVGQLNADLKDSLSGAADSVGKGEQFTQAMQEYHNAMRLKGMSSQAIEYAMKAAITGGLGALGYKAFSIATEKK